MRNSLSSRLIKLESQSTPRKETGAVCVHFVEQGFVDAPVGGWSFGQGDGRAHVWRNAGETDEQLRERAADLARENTKGMPVLMSLL